MKIVFLDRDGVINQYPGDFKYVTNVDEFRLLTGARQALEKLSAAGFKLFVVSNQAGVSKGIFSQQALDAITERMKQKLGEKVCFSGIYYCTHLSEQECSCRKPKTGLLDMAIAGLRQQGLEVDVANSYFVGDTIIDVETGRKAGLKTILVFSGKEKPENKLKWNVVPDFTAYDLSEAVDIILNF